MFRLRFYIHPPQPICPTCLSKNMVVEAVSGRATLASYSINHQPWMPGPELPYVVAIVEIVEQPSLRLTTNLVNCPHDEIQIGMPVRVDVRAPRRSRTVTCTSRCSNPTPAEPKVAEARRGECRGVHQRCRPVRRRSPVGSGSARAHPRCLPRRDRTRRAHPRRHRRVVDVSGSDGGTRRFQRGRCVRRHRRAPPERRLVRQRARDLGPARLRDQGGHGGRVGHVRSRAVLPVRVGGVRAGRGRPRRR